MDFSSVNVGEELEKTNDRFLQVFAKIESTKIKPTEAEYYQHHFLIKVFRHLATLKVLRYGSPIAANGQTVIDYDYSAVLLVARSILESQLMHFLLYVDPDNTKYPGIRFLCWKREGLMTRQKFPPLTKESKEKNLMEKKLIADIESLIKADQNFTVFWAEFNSQGRREFERSGSWAPTWKKAMEIMKISEYQRTTMYSFLSSHAHSEYANLMQNAQMTQSGETKKMIDVQLLTFLPALNTFLDQFIKTFVVKVELAEDAQREIDFWRKLFLHE